MKKLIEIKGKNIFPFSRENFDALIAYYFLRNGITKIGSKRESSDAIVLNYLYNDALQIDLYEFEFILNCIIENITLFESIVGYYKPINRKESLSIENLCKYGLDTFLCHTTVGFSGGRKKTTELFSKALIKSTKETI
jgi:hypothetical protein